MHSKSDLPDRIDLWSDRTQTMIRTIKKNCARNGPWSDSIELEDISDQTQVRSKRLWSEPIALEVASDQTKLRSKRLWLDPIALEITSD